MKESGAAGQIGRWPAEVLDPPAAAIQFSPTMPGSQALEGYGKPLDTMTMLAAPGTLERHYMTALALRALCEGGQLHALAPKDKGGARIAKELRGFGCEVQESMRRHYRICSVRRPQTLHGMDAAIAEGGPRYIEAIGLWSQPGIFSWDRIDPGSMLLIDALPPLAGRGADLGCGIGVLTRAVLESPKVEHVTMIDIDRRAVEAAGKNVGPERTSQHWADVVQGPLPASGLDFVVMNPPFHTGGAEDRALGQEFIRRAHAMLRPGGTCWLTANRHLPYEEVLGQLFSKVTQHAQTNAYKIYEAVK